eukprot:352374-Chlamydomonas_euryale.AAC.3
MVLVWLAGLAAATYSATGGMWTEASAGEGRESIQSGGVHYGDGVGDTGRCIQSALGRASSRDRADGCVRRAGRRKASRARP